MKGGVPSIVLSEILHMFLQSGKNICSGFFWVTGFFCGFYYNLRAGARLWVLLLSWGDNPREGGRIAMLSPFPFWVFSPSPPLSFFLIPLGGRSCFARFHDAAQNGNEESFAQEILGTITSGRFPKERGECGKESARENRWEGRE